MIKAVLLDLDDTLLGNPTQQFVERYVGLLNQHIIESLGLDEIARPLLMSTREVVTSLDPLSTNEQVFYDSLTPYLTVERESFDKAVEVFYREVYPSLRTYTEMRESARPLVEWLIEHGYKVAVATNPFFPRTAIQQRLDWAGLSGIPFNLVTTLEEVHFSKPHPHYYEEVLARLGVQADEAVMVGDDWSNDIVPAWKAGLNTFWLCDKAKPGDLHPVQPDGFGSFEEFVLLVQDRDWLETLVPRPHVPDQIAPRLLGNLAALLGIASHVPAPYWHTYPIENEWAPIEVVCHLRDSETTVQRPRLETILREDNPFLSQPPTPPGPTEQVCPECGWKVSLEFADERLKTVEFLDSLDADAWDRPARHSIFGPTNFLEMANFTAQHDRLHISQLCETVRQCYR
jgi:HAD superfamily hydrolase (TIGR01549 family)